MDISTRRRFYAEEIQAVANLKQAAVVDALASVAREDFLPPGPWTIRSEADFQMPPRQTADADPRHVYHNIGVAIDASRMLFNGAPNVVCGAIDALAPGRGQRALHVGTGLGYYTAVLATCVGSAGRVLAIEVDPDLASQARTKLAGMPWVEVRHGDATDPLNEQFDAILINAGVTHPLESWLTALAPGGRMILPLTATLGPMTTIGKGPMLLLTRTDDPYRLDARFAGFVAIYSAVGVRDDQRNALLGQTLARSPFAPIKSARLDAHDPGEGCWLHTPGFCVSLR